MKSHSTRARLLASTFIGGAAFAAAAVTPAFAQDTSAPQEVVVTGSRIPRPNLTAAEPITTVTQEEFKAEGTTNVESLLNNLPSISPRRDPVLQQRRERHRYGRHSRFRRRAHPGAGGRPSDAPGRLAITGCRP